MPTETITIKTEDALAMATLICIVIGGLAGWCGYLLGIVMTKKKGE